MWPNPQSPQFPADLVTITQEILNENFIFCAVKKKINIWLWMTYIGIAKIVLLQLRKTKFIKRKCRKNTKRKHNS